MELTHDDVIQILKIVQDAPVGRLTLQFGDLKIDIIKGTDGQSSSILPQVLQVPKPEPNDPSPTPDAGAVPVAEAAVPKSVSTGREKLQVINAPILGIFYRRPEPTALPYVEEGSTVDEDTTVGLIEVMKCFNPVKAGVKGRIVKVCVDNGALVEYEQELFLVEPQ